MGGLVGGGIWPDSGGSGEPFCPSRRRAPICHRLAGPASGCACLGPSASDCAQHSSFLAAILAVPFCLPAEPFSFLVVMTERHPFLGKIVTGRVHSGSVAVGDRLKVLWRDGEPPPRSLASLRPQLTCPPAAGGVETGPPGHTPSRRGFAGGLKCLFMTWTGLALFECLQAGRTRGSRPRNS